MDKRVILIVLDSVGVGYMPDAAEFGDVGADTLGYIIDIEKPVLKNLTEFGLYEIKGTSFYGKEKADNVKGAYGKCAELSKAKDTTSGHWEMAGYVRPEPFRTFPNGFPDDIVNEFENLIGRKIIGNEVASGTEIIERLGDKHVATGFPIVYTSADSVFQIAAHEEVIPLEKLYEMCEIARNMLTGDKSVGRVIARPFIGKSGAYKRTENRKDYAVAPEGLTMLDIIKQHGLDSTAIGKIEDIFCNRGITESVHTTNNKDGIDVTIQKIKEGGNGLLFTNLVDFDMLYGHRNDVSGYAKALEYFDSKLPEIISAIHEKDILIITADHGCDPAFPGTDHTREYIPLLIYGKNIRENIDLGVRDSFADISATILDYLELPELELGKSFLKYIIEND